MVEHVLSVYGVLGSTPRTSIRGKKKMQSCLKFLTF